jgi:[ribosomal protein S5]-alanine N-acetyltransferase
MRIVFSRLADVDPAAIIELMNQPLVRRHLPLARGDFGPVECARFVASKERLWAEHGYGPWAFIINDDFAGWGGIQPQSGEVDVALVLHPKYWGAGKILYERIIAFAFGELGFNSVIALLPSSRMRVSGLLKLGFHREDEMTIEGVQFTRFRLMAPRKHVEEAHG